MNAWATVGLVALWNIYVSISTALWRRGFKTWWSTRKPSRVYTAREKAASVWATHIAGSIFIVGCALLLGNGLDNVAFVMPAVMVGAYLGVRQLVLRWLPPDDAENIGSSA